MTTMQDFHKLIFDSSKDQSPYLDALAALTTADSVQMSALASDLAWQDWIGDPKTSGAAAV